MDDNNNQTIPGSAPVPTGSAPVSDPAVQPAAPVPAGDPVQVEIPGDVSTPPPVAPEPSSAPVNPPAGDPTGVPVEPAGGETPSVIPGGDTPAPSGSESVGGNGQNQPM